MSRVPNRPVTKGIRQVRLSHTLRATQVAFDDPNLVSSAGLVPIMALAEAAGLRDLADERLSVPSDKGANPGLKVASLVAGMVAGADSIDDMALLRHGGMGRVFTNAYAPSTLGSFLRAFTFGHVRQLDAVAARFLAGLAGRAPLLPIPPGGPPQGVRPTTKPRSRLGLLARLLQGRAPLLRSGVAVPPDPQLTEHAPINYAMIRA